MQIPGCLTDEEATKVVAAAESVGFKHSTSRGPAYGEAFRDNDRIQASRLACVIVAEGLASVKLACQHPAQLFTCLHKCSLVGCPTAFLATPSCAQQVQDPQLADQLWQATGLRQLCVELADEDGAPVGLNPNIREFGWPFSSWPALCLQAVSTLSCCNEGCAASLLALCRHLQVPARAEVWTAHR
jgi:hypothetical protein